jgi:hypothetical protein
MVKTIDTVPWGAPRRQHHPSASGLMLACTCTFLLAWLLNPLVQPPMQALRSLQIVQSITLLKPETVPLPEGASAKTVLQAPPAQYSSPTPMSAPIQLAAPVGSEASKPPHTEAATAQDSGPLVIDPQALRSAIQSRGVERLAQESGRPLYKNKPTAQDKWRQSMESARVPDCLEPDDKGMGLLNAPVLIYKAITDKCR